MKLMNNNDFYERARMLGHSVENLKRGERIISIIEIHNLEELKCFVNKCTIEKSGKELLCFSAESEGSFESRLLNKVMAYLYADMKLSDEEIKWAESAFPLNMYAESAEHRVFDQPTELNTGVVMSVYNYANVTLKGDAYLYMTNGSLRLYIDSLIREGKAPSEHYDIEILGKTGFEGQMGGDGNAGKVVNNGKDGNCSSAGIAGESGTNGRAGESGTNGETGEKGGDGAPSMDTEIFIYKELKLNPGQMMTVYNCSGAGGKGGKGGKGGNGGNGGKGGNGATCECTGSGAGHGGAGGQGGNGGKGGQGGNAADAAGNILVYVPSVYMECIKLCSKVALPGVGGVGGDAGNAGAGGGKGIGGKHNSDGNDGNAGNPGRAGITGTQGIKSGKPGGMAIRPL